MEIGQEVRTIDGKVGKVLLVVIYGVPTGTYEPLLVCAIEFPDKTTRLELANNLTPIPPEEKKEWFWTSRHPHLQTKKEVDRVSRNYKRIWPDAEVMIFCIRNGEVVV